MECLLCNLCNIESITPVDVVVELECAGKTSVVFFVKSIVVFKKTSSLEYLIFSGGLEII